MNIEAARTNMITQQLRTWDVSDAAVLAAIRLLPRENFVPESQQDLAFADLSITLAHGQAMLTPREEARLLQHLQLKNTDTVLEIGTGSGYLTALLGCLAKHVYSVDLFADFTRQAQVKLATHNITNVTLVTADAARGWEQQGTFDAIIITGSLPFLPASFRSSLKPNGRLIAILGQAPAMQATLITRDATNSWAEVSLFETVVAPLINASEPSAFSF